MEPAISSLSHEIKQTLDSVTSCTAQLYNIRQLSAKTYVHMSRNGNFINTAYGYYGLQTPTNYFKGHKISTLADDLNSFALNLFNVVNECYKDHKILLPALAYLYSHAEKALGTQEEGLLAVENTYEGNVEVTIAIQTLRSNIYSLQDTLLKCQGQTYVDHDYKIVEHLLESQTQKLVPEQVGMTQYALDYTASFYYNFCRCLSGQWNWNDKIGDFDKGSIYLGILPFRSYIYDSLEYMQKEGINVVVCVTKSFENNSGSFQIPIKLADYKEAGIDVFQIPADDYETLPEDDLETIANYIEEKIKEGKKIYVHCKAGRGRSTQAVVAYLVSKRGMTVDEGFRLVQSKRVQVSLGSARMATLEKIAAKHQKKDFRLSVEFELL
jgi:atypical dual specificity phosphatase